jgi:hypothetical protein
MIISPFERISPAAKSGQVSLLGKSDLVITNCRVFSVVRRKGLGIAILRLRTTRNKGRKARKTRKEKKNLDD